MPRIYFSAPYTSKAVKKGEHDYGMIKDRDYMSFLQKVAQIMTDSGFNVVLPHKHTYKWGGTNFNAKAMVNHAFQELSACDILVAYPDNSMGVNVLIGWASMMRKKIIILLEEDQEVSVVHLGLGAISDAKIIKFKETADLERQLTEELKKLI